MAINKNLLKSKIALYGDNQGTLAEAIGITEPTMSQKLNAKREFTQGEIQEIARRYDLSPAEVTEIFFA